VAAVVVGNTVAVAGAECLRKVVWMRGWERRAACGASAVVVVTAAGNTVVGRFADGLCAVAVAGVDVADADVGIVAAGADAGSEAGAGYGAGC
jgi:hypothetical protein